MLNHTFLVAVCLVFAASHASSKNIGWDAAIAKAKAFIAQMTLEEKCNLTAGVPSPCAGFVRAIPRLNFTGMCLQDAPSGVGDNVGFVTSFPGGIHTAATWDKDLMFKRASTIGQEFYEKGVNYALGPMINIDRNALNGRNWEGFGSDPYLAGVNAYQYVQGLQDQGVVATPKHYIGNEQETNRVSDSYSANIDDKTIHEVYLWPFADAVYAGAGSVMCSYNRVNGTHACQNNKSLNGLLKDELGYSGNVMSDWGATHAGIESALGGLDLEMPGGSGFLGYSLLAKVHDGSLTEARVDDMVTRIFAPYFLLEQDQNFPKLDWNRDVTHDHDKLNRELARAGMILLKNQRNTLPLNASVDRLLTIFGSAAAQYDGGLNPGGGPTGQGYDGAVYQGGGSGKKDFFYLFHEISPFACLSK